MKWAFIWVLFLLAGLSAVKCTIDADGPREALCKQAGGTLVQSRYSGLVCVQPVPMPVPRAAVMG